MGGEGGDGVLGQSGRLGPVTEGLGLVSVPVGSPAGSGEQAFPIAQTGVSAS